MNRKLLTILLVSPMVALTGCVTAPTSDKQAISKIRSVTIFCCDYKDDAPLLPESNVSAVLGLASAVTGGAMGALAAGVVQAGVVDYRTSGFYKAAGQDPIKPHEGFLRQLKLDLEASGVSVTVRFPSYFDGYEGRYQYQPAEVTTDAVLEVRQIAAIAHTGDRYYPTVGASYRLLSPDRSVLTDGVVGSSDPGQKLSWAEIHPFGALALTTIQRNNRPLRSKPHVLVLPSERIVVGDSDKLHAEAKLMYRAFVETNSDVAKKVAREALLRE